MLRLPKREFVLALVAVALTIWLIAERVSSNPPSTQPEKAVQSTSISSSNIGFDAVLAHDIDQLIDKSDSAKARWGVFVMSLKDGRVLYSRDGDKLFTPASNMKIFTTAVALDLLGPDFRWRTSVYVSTPPTAEGVIDGDLILYGRGAPDLDSTKIESLPALADQLQRRGVRRVRGKIIGDEGYFRGETYGVGWQWNDLQWYYGAATERLVA
jgi:D-alanyl-D-alanine carboxypeptidase/D-alanyl-D-alanine-endopeptidase (penicillin-binding protein 4)